MFLANVFVHFVPIYNFTQTDDWIQICLIWMIFLGAQELVRTRNHFVVEVMTERLEGKVGKICRAIVCVIELLTYVLICYYGWVSGDKHSCLHAVHSLDAGGGGVLQFCQHFSASYH